MSIAHQYSELGVDPLTLRIAFQGNKGSFSELALAKFFGEEVNEIPFEFFSQAYNAVRTGNCDFGILPIENTLIGTIHPSFDVLSAHQDLIIIADELLQIQHTLIGFPNTNLEQVTTVYSQIPGLEQCSTFLDSHKSWDRVPFKDTSAAVAHVATHGDTQCVAIASERAAKIYNLTVLQKNIENNTHNYTRFAIIAQKHSPIYEAWQHYMQAQQITPNVGIVVFSTPDAPGALLQCLKIFDKHSTNLHKIESRPIIGKPWEYCFTVEIDLENKDITPILSDLESQANTLHTVGVYTRKAPQPI